MLTLIGIIIGLVVGSLIGALVVQYFFNNGKRPTTHINNEEGIEKELEEFISPNSIEVKLENNA